MFIHKMRILKEMYYISSYIFYVNDECSSPIYVIKFFFLTFIFLTLVYEEMSNFGIDIPPKINVTIVSRSNPICYNTISTLQDSYFMILIIENVETCPVSNMLVYYLRLFVLGKRRKRQIENPR